MKKGDLESFVRRDPEVDLFVLDVLGLVDKYKMEVGEAYYSCMTVMDVLRERLDESLKNNNVQYRSDGK